MTIVPVFAACVAMSLAAHARSDDAPTLQLKPCTIEMIDGRTVEGQFAVPFEMDDHLIVYCPRSATMRSFLIDHVHALTVDGRQGPGSGPGVLHVGPSVGRVVVAYRETDAGSPGTASR